MEYNARIENMFSDSVTTQFDGTETPTELLRRVAVLNSGIVQSCFGSEDEMKLFINGAEGLDSQTTSFCYASGQKTVALDLNTPLDKQLGELNVILTPEDTYTFVVNAMMVVG